jgi:phosphotransferase family enzyme
MRSDFASLLEQAGLDASERGFWQRVIMIDNRVLLPAKRLEEGDLMKLHGFNALILDRNGVPTHFCKCRPPTKDWIRQTEFCTRMSMEPALRHVLPSARAVGSTDLHMAISAYVPGRAFEPRVPRMRTGKLHAAIQEILLLMETIALRAVVVDPELFGGQTRINLAAEAEWAFDTIPPALFAPGQAAVVRDAISAAGTVRRVLQHGDLWPRNILWYDGHWWLLDFDTFGRIQVPLYDVFHMVRSCWVLRQGRGVIGWTLSRARLQNPSPSWVQDLRSSATMERGQTTLAWARDRQGLTKVEAIGALAFYLVDTVARMCRRQHPMRYVAPFLSDLGILAECLEAGETLADAFGDAAS